MAFASEPVTVEVDAVAQPRSVVWGLGILADGQRELLGAWPEPVPGEMYWPPVLEDLARRGVESVRYVLSEDPEALLSPLNCEYPSALVLPANLQLGVFEALPTSRRRAILASQYGVHGLQRHAARAVRRHGAFSSLTEATAFTVDALERAEARTRNARCGGA